MHKQQSMQKEREETSEHRQRQVSKQKQNHKIYWYQ